MPSTAAASEQVAITADRLVASPYNVRKDKKAIDNTGPLEASLLEFGQLMPIVVHPLKGTRKFGVFAGQRRMLAFQRLIERGDLPADHPIAASVRDVSPAMLKDLSLIENLIRRDLYDYEVARAIADSYRAGRTAEQIARIHGQDLLWVKQHLRLGLLAAPIFEAYAAGKIDDARARAYAATEDQDLQLAVWNEMAKRPAHEHTAQNIRARLKVDDAELGRLLEYVGEQAYADAGGRYELDLFATDSAHRGAVRDEGKLRKLVDEKLSALRDDLRTRTGRTDLRFVTEPPRSTYGTDYNLRLSEVNPRGSGPIKLPDGDVVAYVRLHGAEPDVSFWWASRSAQNAARKKPPAPGKPRAAPLPRSASAAIATYSGSTDVQQVNAAIRANDGVTQDGVEIFRSLRRLVMRAFLIWDARSGGTAGLDWFVWSQLRIDAADRRAPDLGVYRLVDGGQGRDPAIATDHFDMAPAMEVWETARAELAGRPAFTLKDDVEAFLDYRRESASVKGLAAAVVAGMALERSLNAHGYRAPVHDVLGAECGVTGVHRQSLRRLWTPTAELLGRLGREQLLRIAEPFVDDSTLNRWRKGKASESPGLIAKLLTTGDPSADLDKMRGAMEWVHPLLAFPERERVAKEPETQAEDVFATGDELLERAAS